MVNFEIIFSSSLETLEDFRSLIARHHVKNGEDFHASPVEVSLERISHSFECLRLSAFSSTSTTP